MVGGCNVAIGSIRESSKDNPGAFNTTADLIDATAGKDLMMRHHGTKMSTLSKAILEHHLETYQVQPRQVVSKDPDPFTDGGLSVSSKHRQFLHWLVALEEMKGGQKQLDVLLGGLEVFQLLINQIPQLHDMLDWLSKKGNKVVLKDSGRASIIEVSKFPGNMPDCSIRDPHGGELVVGDCFLAWQDGEL